MRPPASLRRALGDPWRSNLFAARAATTYATNLLVALLSLVNVLITSRALGPEGRGQIAILTTIAILTSNIGLLGVQEANANIGGTRPESRRSLATNSLVLALCSGALSAGVVGGIVHAFPAVGGGSAPWLLALVLATLPLLIAQTYVQLLVQAEYGFRMTNAAWLLPAVVNVAVNGAMAAAGVLSVESAVLTWLGGQTLATAALVAYVGLRHGFGRFDLALARSSLSFGAKSHIGRVMMLGNYRLDQWILGAIAGPRELGLYSVAVAWAEALFYLPTALTMAQRPDIVRADETGAGAQGASLYRLSTLLTGVLAAAFAILAPFLCVTAFGDAFAGSVVDLRILAAGSLGMVALKQLGGALTARNRPLRSSAAVAVALAATVALDVLLIPGFGDRGAATASTIAYSLGGAAVIAIFARTHGMPMRRLAPQLADLERLRSLVRRRPVVRVPDVAPERRP